ncbi:D-alanine--D-alanine ligase [Pleionea litopenaei]|uniref:D-alanine--D-alanine ligase n=1 Tax=Pleionea litopenaei TaxID=3070815 RepID=A0AA51X7T8_9GAMM|nr:D-alanine--D-alanine ligase [Pleionea sp. HL-JVS1]WMS88672.1 D-alanine--D-alanine ligase [Pleionea sp. HL-JVS1]
MTIDTKQFGKVAVLYGGDSAERDVSLRSGEAVYHALIEGGVDALLFDPSKRKLNELNDLGIKHAWIALHGRGGEDGQVQAVLQYLGISYTGSGVMGSAIAMDKWRSKMIWKSMTLPVAPHVLVKETQSLSQDLLRSITARLGPVVFVKPSREGSSVGMSKVSSPDQLEKAIRKALEFDKEVLVESFIEGREYTVSILGEQALPSISMVTPREFYDYEAKYHSNETQYFCPSGLSDQEEQELGKLALNAFYAVGCKGWGRVDFIRDNKSNEFKLLEANTVPGMTQTSLVPKAAKQKGISFNQLVLEILKQSL